MILGEHPREVGPCEGQTGTSACVSHRGSSVRQRLDVFLSDPEKPRTLSPILPCPFLKWVGGCVKSQLLDSI